MKKTLLFLLLIQFFLSIFAQEAAEQVLVFRNTGEVNLFYSDRLDSIVCSSFDKDSVLHEEPVSQIFYSKDTTMLIPLAEIDSVAFGERNVMEFRRNVKELTEEAFSWIIRTEGNSIYYQQDTPQTILPTVGQKLFCGFSGSNKQTSLFPYGLSAKVISVLPASNEICITVERVELNEIFDKLFFAGSISERYPAKGIRKASIKDGLSLESSIPLGGMGEIGVSGNIYLHGNVVISLFRHYYHADLDADYSFGFDVSLKSEDSNEINYSKYLAEQNIGTFYRILNLDAAIGAFADVSAEMTLGLEMERSYHRNILWTRQNGENSFEVRNSEGNEPYEDKATLDLTLDGNIYFGPLLQLDFTLVGDVAGARAKLKLGPELNGHINLGMVQQMHEYNPRLYGEAMLNACNKLSFEGYATNRQYLVWGDVDEHLILSMPLRWARRQINLFPNYFETRGTQVTNSQITEVSVATKSDGEIVHEVETGFELINDQTKEIVDSTFVGMIDAKCDNVQGISFEFEVPKQKDQSFAVRPVFHYAGYTVSAAPARVQKGFQIQPIIFSAANGAVTYAASYPFTGEVTGGGTNYRAGAYLPIPVCDSVFQKGPKTIDIITYISGNQEDELCGTWSGKEGGDDIVLVFNDDGSGLLNNDVFTYQLNVPQSGQVLLTFEDKEKSPLVLTILRLREGIMQYHRGKDKTIYTLRKES